MKELLVTLWERLKTSSGPTRVVIGAGVVLILALAGIASYRAANPHMVVLRSGLDDADLSAATSALSAAQIRFDTTLPPGPYTLFVPQGDKYSAMNALAAGNAFGGPAKGIPANAESGSVFDDHATRLQRLQKRDWEDLEVQLEEIAYVQSARVRIAGPPPSDFLRDRRSPSVAVVLTLRGGYVPSSTERQALASIVRGASGAPLENITISDGHGEVLFDGSRDQALDNVVRFEEEVARARTRRAQDYLNGLFGPGMALVSVAAEYDHERTETVAEALDPKPVKMHVVERTSSTPVDPPVGGPAGTVSNIDPSDGSSAPTERELAETKDEETSYASGRNTTHRLKDAPTLKRLTVTLALHESLAQHLQAATEAVKEIVGFTEERDHFSTAALPLASVQVDEQGNPIKPVAEPAPTAPNRTLTLLMERGVEILAAVAFLFVLLRSLKKGVTAPPQPRAESRSTASVLSDLIPEEEIDMEMLARKHVESLVEEDPEKVAALLSRWALGENFYAEAK